MADTADEVLDQLVADAGDVTVTGSEYSRAGRVLAARPAANAIELRLGPDIAEAARRTPDTSASSRGEDWVRFSPNEWDDHAADRLEAWFWVAWRAAGDRPSQK